jgi:membrane protease subunit HflK
MNMESNNQSTNRPDNAEETLVKEEVKTEPIPSRAPLKERFKRLMQNIFRAGASLARKTKSAYAGIMRVEGEVSPLDDIKGAFRHIPLKKKGLGFLFAGFSLGIYLLSGVYTVEPGEVAVSRIFGKEVRQSITEGLHYRLPWPFEAIEKVNVTEIRRVDVGMPFSQAPLLFPKKKSSSPQAAPAKHGVHGGPETFSAQSKTPNPIPITAKNQFLTGDENILDIRMNIQYQIKDASDYLFNMNSPDSIVPFAVRAAVTEFFGQMPVEDLLTVAKSQIQKRIALKAQRTLDGYDTGLYIVHVNLQEVNPPKEVAEAFRDVASAKEEREERINKAQGYWNALIPEARGKAHTMISDAEGYREEAINQSRGDAQKFSAMLNEYQRAKNVTEYRLYLETIEMILSKAKRFVVDSKKERVNLKFVK